MPGKGDQPRLPPKFRERVEAALVALSMPRAELARRCKCNRSSISGLLDGEAIKSNLLYPIIEALDLEFEEPVYLADDERELLNVWRALSDIAKAEVRRDAVRRLTLQANPDPKGRELATGQALESSLKEAADQTTRVPSGDEGSPRSPRTRRAPRSR